MRPSPLLTGLAVPRPTTVRPLAVVPTAASSEIGDAAAPPSAGAPASAIDRMVAAVEQATTRIAELLEERAAHRRLVVDLQESNAALQKRGDLALEAASRHEARASEALLKIEHLQAQRQVQDDEQERLKASVNCLLTMFGSQDVTGALA